VNENNNLQRSNEALQKKVPDTIKEKGQYVLAFGVIATMLMVAGFPMFVIFFFGIFAYFLWKTFSAPSRSETREIFEFYLAANDVLRDDERRWYGFEMQEVVNRGERVLRAMNGAPPLVYFTLGALYHKAGDYKSAVNHLEYVLENQNSDESTYVYPSPELRNYVKVLRKIEREPAEAPLTSAAVRALERARRNRGKFLLDDSREKVTEQKRQKRELAAEEKKKKAELEAKQPEIIMIQSVTDADLETRVENNRESSRSVVPNERQNGDKPPKKAERENKHHDDPFANRKPITEVLHDIYDKNIQ
jgi:tetratricopeptide (TPR) repeat protein